MNENKLLFEYYNRVSKPQDSDILGDWQIWVYGSDREAFPPHCHIRLKDGSFEFEVSLLSWEVINIKNSQARNSWDSIDKDIKNAFFQWLNRPSIKRDDISNKWFLYNSWDEANSENTLDRWIDLRNGIDKDLLIYLNKEIDCVKLHKTVIDKLLTIYFSDKNQRKELHKLSPQDLLNKLAIKCELKDNEEAINAVINAEKNVYMWSLPR